ncbi:MAG: VanZ family protein [Faecalicoccus sp.]|nr:VanZ family protein [Faecalicoccus sp.]
MTKRKLFWTVAALSITLLIFMFSQDSAPDSSEKSGFILMILEYFHIHLSQHFIRKAAHFTIYTLLSISYIQMFKAYGFKHYAIIGIVLAILWASLDEYHQTFVDGRSGEIRDILLDTTGILFGYLITTLIKKIRPDF